jgi:beta-barrel assembly-enhancing protease
MKRALVFLSVLLIAVGALYFGLRRPQSTTVSPSAVLAMAADAQRDLTRTPMRLTRLSDQEEIRIGNELAAQYSLPSATLSASESGLENYLRQVGSTVSRRAHRKLLYGFISCQIAPWSMLSHFREDMSMSGKAFSI